MLTRRQVLAGAAAATGAVALPGASAGPAAAHPANLRPVLKPHVRYFDGSRRGYLRCEVSRRTWPTVQAGTSTLEPS